MNYNDIRKLGKLNNPNEPTNEELQEIEEHLDDYIDEQIQPIIKLTIIRISDTLISKSAFISD